MHELTVAMALVDAAEAEARRVGATRISRIGCRIGLLRQVDADLLREAFAVARRGATANATLEVQTDGLRLRCRTCGVECQVDAFAAWCPRCRSEDVELRGGDALELTTLDLELEEALS